jgi:hypothetical protein
VPRRSALRKLALASTALAAAVPFSGWTAARAEGPAAPGVTRAAAAMVAASPVVPARHRAPGTVIVAVRSGRVLEVRSRPRGRVVARLGDRGEFGSRSAAPVFARRGRWLGIPVPQLPNDRLGWIDSRSKAITLHRSTIVLRVDRARRSLELRAGRQLVLRARVGVGAPGSPTPAGRFAVTDKVAGSQFSASYGCCVLALSAHQPHPPAGWQNGTRMAIHATDAPSTIGAAASAGCVHAADSTMHELMARVPVGTPVLIR